MIWDLLESFPVSFPISIFSGFIFLTVVSVLMLPFTSIFFGTPEFPTVFVTIKDFLFYYLLLITFLQHFQHLVRMTQYVWNCSSEVVFTQILKQFEDVFMSWYVKPYMFSHHTAESFLPWLKSASCVSIDLNPAVSSPVWSWRCCKVNSLGHFPVPVPDGCYHPIRRRSWF